MKNIIAKKWVRGLSNGRRHSGAPPVTEVITGLPFVETFESNNLNLWDSVGGTVTIVNTEAYEGTRCAMTTVATGQQSDNYLEYNFGDHLGIGGTSTGMNDVWVRIAHKWASDYEDTDVNIVGQKLLLVNMQNPSSNRRRYQCTLNYMRSTGVYFFDLYRWNEDTSFGGTLHHIQMPGFPRVLGRWEEFIFRMRMNTLGNSDGHLDCWTKAESEGSFTQQLNLTNLNYRDSTAFTPNRFIGLSNYDTLTTRDGDRRWDSLEIRQEPFF